MKIPFKALLLAAATSAAVSTSQAANGDLIVGFDHGSGNTLVFNIGPYSSLFFGETWNLNSQLVAAGFDSLNPGQNINFGVIGYKNAGSILYSTVSPVDGGSDFNGARASIAGMSAAPAVQARDGGSQAVDWYSETEWHFNSGSWFANTLTDPNSSSTHPILLNSFSVDTTTAASFGNFGLSESGVLTYSAVPEPSTFALAGGLSILLLSFRRKSMKK